MVCIDFYPEDYITEIDTDDLEAELRRRKKPVPESDYESLAANLRDAWAGGDAVRFERLLILLESTERQRADRDERIAQRYREMLAERQASLPVTMQ